jgi:hypothetical protein
MCLQVPLGTACCLTCSLETYQPDGPTNRWKQATVCYPAATICRAVWWIIRLLAPLSIKEIRRVRGNGSTTASLHSSCTCWKLPSFCARRSWRLHCFCSGQRWKFIYSCNGSYLARGLDTVGSCFARGLGRAGSYLTGVVTSAAYHVSYTQLEVTLHMDWEGLGVNLTGVVVSARDHVSYTQLEVTLHMDWGGLGVTLPV